MRIVCPSCSTAYTVPDQKIGATGRKVRCARCATRWVVMPEEEDEVAAAAFGASGVDEPDTMEPVPERRAAKAMADAEDDLDAAWGEAAAEMKAGADARDDPFAAEGFGPMADEDLDEDEDEPTAAVGVETAADEVVGDEKALARSRARAGDDLDPALFGAAGSGGAAAGGDAAGRPKASDTVLKPRIVAHHRPRPSIMSRVKQVVWRVRTFLFHSRITIGVTIFLAALLLPAGGILLRVPIVRAYPKIASLFTEIGMPVNLTGLEFRYLNTLRELENGQPVLVVEGAVANLTLSTLAMPGLRLALRGADGQEIYAWSVEPKTATVPAGDEVRFRSRLAAPPEEAVDIQLRFTEPKTRHAVLP